MRSKGKHIIWPVYFDTSKSWEEGRRVSKDLAIRTPDTDEIVKAAVSAGLKAELQPGTAYPRTPHLRTGFVLVESKDPKAKIVKLIASRFSKSQVS